MGFRELFIHMRGMKHYFIAVLGTFIIGIYLGYSNPEQYHFLLHAQSDRLSGIAQSLSKMEHKQLWIFGFIFLNNTLVSILMVFSGVFFALIPLYALLSNGMLLGFTADNAVAEHSLFWFMKGVLHHGIIEIPAILIACAYGLRFGLLAIEGILFFPFAGRRAINGAKMLRFLKLTLPLMGVLAGLMLIAALIESFVTFAILK